MRRSCGGCPRRRAIGVVPSARGCGRTHERRQGSPARYARTTPRRCRRRGERCGLSIRAQRALHSGGLGTWWRSHDHQYRAGGLSKCAAGYDLALMATAPRTSVELERPGGRADVLIVRRITPGARIRSTGPARHWTIHYTLAGARFSLRARGRGRRHALVYRRDDRAAPPLLRALGRHERVLRHRAPPRGHRQASGASRGHARAYRSPRRVSGSATLSRA